MLGPVAATTEADVETESAASEEGVEAVATIAEEVEEVEEAAEVEEVGEEVEEAEEAEEEVEATAEELSAFASSLQSHMVLSNEKSVCSTEAKCTMHALRCLLTRTYCRGGAITLQQGALPRERRMYSSKAGFVESGGGLLPYSHFSHDSAPFS